MGAAEKGVKEVHTGRRAHDDRLESARSSVYIRVTMPTPKLMVNKGLLAARDAGRSEQATVRRLGTRRETERCYAFLKRLRAGGRSNMYGAIPYLMRTFALERERAFQLVCDWLDHHDGTAPAPRSEKIIEAGHRPREKTVRARVRCERRGRTRS
jgi:hypothetical protein